MNDKVLLVGGGIVSFTKCAFKTINTYKKIPFILKPFRLLSLRFNIGVRCWVSYDSSDFNGINTVVLFDCENLLFHTRTIEKIAPTCRLIIYFWNPMILYNPPILERISTRWELWTFDYADAKKYHMRYGGQFICENLLSQVPSGKITTDLFFIGLNKGRFKKLRKLESALNSQYGIKTQFYYVDKVRSFFDKKYSSPIRYNDMIKLLSCSRAIFDYTQKGQSGLTLRVLEGLFLGKKIVTNNESLKKYDFFDNSLIFILGERSLEEITSFLNQETGKVGYDVLSRYFSERWLNRIINNQELCDYLDGEKC